MNISRMRKILCVEDAPEVLALIEHTLNAHQLVFATSVKQALDLLNRDIFALIILDLDLPDGSGLEILASISSVQQGGHLTTPIIILTGKTDFASKVSAFSLGADDFILKPFDPSDLKLRVESKLRKLASLREDSSSLKIGSLVCNIQEQRIFKGANQDPVELTSLEFRIFQLLARSPNRIYPREEILNRVWGSAISVTDRAVDVHVSNIRKKISGTDVIVEAVIGSGYRLVVESKNRTSRVGNVDVRQSPNF